MTILYLHGLESKLSDEKKAVLQDHGNVIAPDMDYYKNSSVFELLIELHKEHRFDVVMGSSMGGFMSYYFANKMKVPALLFNPALPHRPVHQDIPNLKSEDTSPFLQFALGGKDDVIEANNTLKWLAENRNEATNFQLAIHSEMTHRIPKSIFEIEVLEFFRKLQLI